MPRTKALGPLSPKLLKHFAAAAVVLTATLAMFASGEEWGAQAQIEAVDAKNKLIATETEKLGTKKLAAKLKVSSDVTAAGFVNDNPGDFGGDSGGGGSGAGNARGQIARQGSPQPSEATTAPGASMTVPGVPISAPPGLDPKKRRSASPQPELPSEAQMAAITANSRERSGRSAQPDD